MQTKQTQFAVCVPSRRADAPCQGEMSRRDRGGRDPARREQAKRNMEYAGDIPPPRRRVHFVAEQNGRKISLGASAPKYLGVSLETASLHPARKI